MGKKKKFSGQKASEKARREQELADYGRLLSLRPSVTHESSKDYKRAREKEIARREMSSDDFFYFIFRRVFSKSPNSDILRYILS